MSEITDFEQAIERAKLILDPRNDESALGFPRLSPDSVRNSYLQIRGFRQLTENPQQLIEQSIRDCDAFDALRFGIAKTIYLEQALPAIARAWLARYLQGQIEEPIRRDGRRRNPDKEAMIYIAVRTIAEDGLPIYRKHSNSNSSVLEAVAAALRHLGLTPTSYDGVKRIYLTIKKTERPDGGFTVHP